jgi:hypothetical protein
MAHLTPRTQTPQASFGGSRSDLDLRMENLRGTRAPTRPRSLQRRDDAVVRRYEQGETLTSIGASLGLTRERVRQIVKASGAEMPGDRRCGAARCETAPRPAKQYCAAHQHRFALYGDPLGRPAAVQLLREQHGTYASYSDGGCRCALCRMASADKRREGFHRLHPEWRYMPQKARKAPG